MVDATLIGLTNEEAARRRATVGANALPEARRRSFAWSVVEIVREPMFLLLIAATTLYVIFGDLTEALTLGASVVVIMAIELVQQRRTESAVRALRELASPTARVRRDGDWVPLDARELVPDDVIQIAEGDRVPADARLVDGAPISVDESLLTGESVPAVRDPARGDLAHAGTLVTAGHAIAIVTQTGARSEMGRIGASIAAIDVSPAPVQRDVMRLVPRLAALAIGLAIVLVVIRGLGEGRWLAALLSGITLAMSLLPEELPVVLSVFFTFGAWRIARFGVLARRASSIETLGAMTVLCVDKTGTLTENRMSIARLSTEEGELAVAPELAELPEHAHRLVEYGLLACPREPTDPMDRAFATLAARALADTEHVHPRWVPLREYPLRSGLLAVTHAWRDDAQQIVIATKGAPEAIFDLCHLEADELARWRARADAMAKEGARVLGVAAASENKISDEPHDYAFRIVGLVGLADPLRADTAEMVARCRGAGIRVVMVTGDHRETARAIARAAGIDATEVIGGDEIDALDDAALAARLARTHVIARAVPAHKLRIVRALQADGEVVGMTGDGVNDAPALAAADIGIAMGGRGSDVAREAAGLVLVRDDLRAIVDAARTGRAIFDNLRASIAYLVAVHIAIAGVSLLPPLFGWGGLLAPIHIVFLELVIDPTCSIVFEMDPPAADLMRRPPRAPGTALLERRRLLASAALGAVALAAAIAVIAWAVSAEMPLAARSAIAFATLVAGNLAILIACRAQPLRANRGALLLVAGAGALAAAALLVPWLRALFDFAPLPAATLAAAVAIPAIPVLVARRLLQGRRSSE
ncbi:MAG TPA: cation-translocating P-type ATPase [Kofleriaceae bacterium]|nr:cation-translocating P-type ATPase [Kofleriaceae bacterium]